MKSTINKDFVMRLICDKQTPLLATRITTMQTAHLIYAIALLVFILMGSRSYFSGKHKNLLVPAVFFWGGLLGLLFVLAPYFGHGVRHATVNSEGGINIYKTIDGHYHVPLSVNDREIVFLVDTGATTIALSRAYAERIGINIAELTYNRPVHTANGVTGSALVNLRKVRLADYEKSNVRALVVDSELKQSLLGMSFLSKFGRIEIENDVLTL